jgi:hypothetical protein
VHYDVVPDVPAYAAHRAGGEADLPAGDEAAHAHAPLHPQASGTAVAAGSGPHGVHAADDRDLVAGSCSVCAACCLGAAPPVSTADLPIPDLRATLATAQPVQPASHHDGRLERPPRSHRA